MLNFLWNDLYFADTHSDFVTVCDNEYFDNPSCHLDLKRVREYMNLQVMAFFEKPEKKPWLEWQKICRLYDDFYQSVLSFAGVDILKNGKQLLDTERSWLVLALEAVDSFTWFDDKKYFLDQLTKMNFKILGLFWNNDNWAGSGADSNLYHNVDLGLTKQGKRFLQLFAEYNIVLDLAHSSKRSFWQAVKIHQKPFMVSHTCCMELCTHRRNLTDEQLKKIGESGGYVGIAMYPFFLNGTNKADLQDVAEHLNHAIRIAGVDAVGLGTDFDGIEVLPTGVTGCESLPMLCGALQKKGFSYAEIEKVMGKNLRRFLLENLKE